MKIIIVGGVAGGASAAARLRRLDEKAEIIIFERGNFVSFANCGLPYFIGGEITDEKKLTLQTPDSFRSRFNIDVRINSEVTEINPVKKTVEFRNTVSGECETESYDKLILSPGAKPVMPDIPGIKCSRVFALRDIPDMKKIMSFIDSHNPESAVIVGGGYIGIEMAENLKKIGLDVTIIELSDHLLSPLDSDMAADVQAYLRKNGVKTIIKRRVTAVEETASGIIAKLDSGCVAADMLIMSVGVRPDTRLAKRCGILTNSIDSVVVDKHMKTSNDDIYAVGDAAIVKTSFPATRHSFLLQAPPTNRVALPRTIYAELTAHIKERRVHLF